MHKQYEGNRTGEDLAEERFDLRRFLLLSGSRLPWLLVGMLAGILLFGGGYLIRTQLLAGAPVYRSDALYYITFREGSQDTTQLYYNDYTWNDVLDSDVIAGVAEQMSGGITKEQIAAATRIPTMSDIRMFHIYVEDRDPETAENIQDALGLALSSFAHETEGFEEIHEWDRKEAAVIRDRSLLSRWVICGAVLGGLAALLVLAYVYVMDDTVRLETDLYRIPGLRERVAGSLFAGSFAGGKDAAEQDFLRKRLQLFLGERSKFLLLGTDGEPADRRVGDGIAALLPEAVQCEDTAAEDILKVWCIPAGRMNTARLEREWNALQKEGSPEAVILYDVDHALHRVYYYGKERREEKALK